MGTSVKDPHELKWQDNHAANYYWPNMVLSILGMSH
jgi:hypothetical protein